MSSLRADASSRAIRRRAAQATGDASLRQRLAAASDRSGAKRELLEERTDWSAIRDGARDHREDARRNLPELLDRLERSVTEAGGRVHRAADSEEAVATILSICGARGTSDVVKSKSMVGEEIEVNRALEGAGIGVTETDLGEYIVQRRDEPPSHIRTPAIHLGASDVASLFASQANRSFDPDDRQGLLDYARGVMRDAFAQADVGVTGANMAVAETGTIVLVEGEGNIRMTTSLPGCHIAVMGVEKVVRDWSAASHLLEALVLAAHQKPLEANVSFITGSARMGDDGPREFHLVLLDNGRSRMRDGPYAQVLDCIRCGACLDACPVFRQIGGHAYGSTYSGPIGALVTPLIEGVDRAGRLADLCTLCGACADACPARVPLDELLVQMRADSRAASPVRAERAIFGAWARAWTKPSIYRTSIRLARAVLRAAGGWRVAGGRGGRRWLVRAPWPASSWTASRDLRAPSGVPFHRRWREKRGDRAT